MSERDVRIVPPNPKAPGWARGYAVWVDGRVGGFCKTREKAEQAAEHERSRDCYPEERAAEALRDHFGGREGVKWVGVEQTGGGCIAAAVYYDGGPYVWVTDAGDYDGHGPGWTLGVYPAEDDECWTGEWCDELSVGRLPEVALPNLGALAEVLLAAASTGEGLVAE